MNSFLSQPPQDNTFSFKYRITIFSTILDVPASLLFSECTEGHGEDWSTFKVKLLTDPQYHSTVKNSSWTKIEEKKAPFVWLYVYMQRQGF